MGDPGTFVPPVFEELARQAEEKMEGLLASFQVNIFIIVSFRNALPRCVVTGISLKAHKRENFFGSDFGFLSKLLFPMKKK